MIQSYSVCIISTQDGSKYEHVYAFSLALKGLYNKGSANHKKVDVSIPAGVRKPLREQSDRPCVGKAIRKIKQVHERDAVVNVPLYMFI